MTFERFTDHARKVMALANQEAQRFNHEYIGTEHVLLGMMKESTGVGISVLKSLDVDPRKVRLEVEKLIKSGPDLVTLGKLPMTPWTKAVIGFAEEESRNLSHNYVGTEHLLLGLMRDEGIAGTVLRGLGLRPEELREEVLALVGPRMGVQRTGLITLRDLFAAEAMNGLLAGSYSGSTSANLREVPEESYRIADAMIEARKPRKDAK